MEKISKIFCIYLCFFYFGCSQNVKHVKQLTFDQKGVVEFPSPPNSTHRLQIKMTGEVNCSIQIEPLTNNRKTKFFGELKVYEEGVIDTLVYKGDYYEYDLGLEATSLGQACSNNQLTFEVIFYQ